MKRMVSLIISICMIFSLSGPSVVAVTSVGTSARGAILIEAKTGEVLYEKNANQILQMASTTKIMTTLLCLESGNLDEYFTVDPEAIKVEGSSMGLLEGDLVTKRILCYGMMLPSGNDAANATAVKIGGSIDKFVELMNNRAKEIGMNNTNFVTPSGLDDYTDLHYSTAYDMALLARQALKNPYFAEICSTKNAKVEFGNPAYGRWLTNSNKLLTNCPGAIGVKTGFTDKARRCLVSACERDGVTLICVTLNDPNDWQDHSSLYEYGFSKMKKISIPIENQDMVVNVVGGKRELAYLKLSEPSELTLYNGDAQKITKKIILPKFCYAPLNKGEIVGQVQYYCGDKVIKEIPVMVDESVEELQCNDNKNKNIFKRIFDKST